MPSLIVDWLFKLFKELFDRRTGEIDALHGIRAGAILAIILLHLYVPVGLYLNVQFEAIDRIARNLTSGVDLFFVLSGFLIYSSFLKQPLTKPFLILYAKKRARRILPAYYAALIGAAIYVFYLIQAIDGSDQAAMVGKLERSLQFAWSDLLFVSNYTDRLLEPGWSLSVEVHFYALLPLLLWLLRRFRDQQSKLAGVWIGLSFLVTLLRFLQFENSDTYFYTHTRIDAIFAGMIVAEVYATYRPSKFVKWLSLVLGIVLVVSAHLCTIDGWFYRTLRYNFFAAGFSLFLFASLSSARLALLLSNVVFRLIARLSYTLYLWHPILLMIGIKQGRLQLDSSWVHIVAVWAGSFLFAVACSILFYALFERPFRYRSKQAVVS